MKLKRYVTEGEIVFRKDEMAAGQSYRYSPVIKTHKERDRKVRSADKEYKIPRRKRVSDDP